MLPSGRCAPKLIIAWSWVFRREAYGPPSSLSCSKFIEKSRLNAVPAKLNTPSSTAFSKSRSPLRSFDLLNDSPPAPTVASLNQTFLRRNYDAAQVLTCELRPTKVEIDVRSPSFEQRHQVITGLPGRLHCVPPRRTGLTPKTCGSIRTKSLHTSGADPPNRRPSGESVDTSLTDCRPVRSQLLTSRRNLSLTSACGLDLRLPSTPLLFVPQREHSTHGYFRGLLPAICHH